MMYVLIGLGCLVGLIGLMAIVGMLLPKGHVARRCVRTTRTPEDLWAAITDFESQQSWRALKSMTRLEDRDGKPVWREEGKHGPLTYTVEVADAPSKLVTRICDDKLPFGGRWIYEIEPANGQSQLTITEDGEVYNPIFRVFMKLSNEAATIEAYIRALGEKLGEPLEPQPA